MFKRKKRLGSWSTEPKNQLRIVSGIVKHPDGLWQTWVLTPDNTITCCSAHIDQVDAVRVSEEIVNIFQSRDRTKLELLPEILHSEYKVKPLPPDMALNIQREVLDRFTPA